MSIYAYMINKQSKYGYTGYTKHKKLKMSKDLTWDTAPLVIKHGRLENHRTEWRFYWENAGCTMV